jgi:hypothetical protein
VQRRHWQSSAANELKASYGTSVAKQSKIAPWICWLGWSKAKSFASVAIVFCAERARLNAGDGPSLVPPLAVRLDAKQVPTV